MPVAALVQNLTGTVPQRENMNNNWYCKSTGKHQPMYKVKNKFQIVIQKDMWC